MGELYISQAEEHALESINSAELDRAISQAIDAVSASGLRDLRLSSCGPYVASRLREFEAAVRDYATAKSQRKVSETAEHARRAGMRLSMSVGEMKRRLEKERVESERFQIDDNIFQPHSFSQNMGVTVSYRWRQTATAEWNSGSITFQHECVLRPDMRYPQPKRKPSAAKQNELRQTELSETWQHLKSLSVQAVLEYFRNGGDGAAIPKTFKVRPDLYSGYLNNRSADFWST